MSSRYDKYSTVKNGIYTQTIYPEVQLNNVDFHKITFKYGDRLDLLAKKYFNNSKLWWVIAMVNDVDGDSLIVPVGTELYIPKQVSKYVY